MRVTPLAAPILYLLLLLRITCGNESDGTVRRLCKREIIEHRHYFRMTRAA